MSKQTHREEKAWQKSRREAAQKEKRMEALAERLVIGPG